MEPRPAAVESANVRVLLLDDDPANLILRTAVLRQNGYECLPLSLSKRRTNCATTPITVLDYHVDEGKFGTEVAMRLRYSRPSVPIRLEQRPDERDATWGVLAFPLCCKTAATAVLGARAGLSLRRLAC